MAPPVPPKLATSSCNCALRAGPPSPENPVPAQHHMLVAGDESASLGGTGLEATMDFIGTAKFQDVGGLLFTI